MEKAPGLHPGASSRSLSLVATPFIQQPDATNLVFLLDPLLFDDNLPDLRYYFSKSIAAIRI